MLGRRRRSLLLAPGGLALAGAAPPVPASAAPAAPPPPAPSVTLPMRFERGGTFVVDFELDGRPHSGVVDTGSPFLTVSGRCGELPRDWGCIPSSVDSQARRARRRFAPTYEVYGLQEDGLTDWLSGDVVLRGRGGEAEELVRMPGLTYGASEGFRNREGSYGGNSAAPMFGLVRDVAEGIRPSFMSQAGFPGFAVDFERGALTLGRLPDRGAEAGRRTLELVDLRPWGAPAREYACRVERLVVSEAPARPAGGGAGWGSRRRRLTTATATRPGKVNGYDVDVGRPIYAIFDTGTTGMLVSRRLWDTSLLQLGVASAVMELPTVSGDLLVVGASTRSCRRDCLLVATPIDVAWQPPAEEVGPEGPPEFEVIFVGLAFLTSRGYLDVDLDRGLLGLGEYRVARADRERAPPHV